jgi:N-carbamoylputrescine amidase
MAEPIPGPTTEAFQRSHAITNGCCVASVNRIGHEAPAGRDGIEFRGQSFIADTPEETIANAGQEETVLLCEIDLAKVDVTRTHWPFLRDRRIDAYGYLTCRLIDE